ncbi:MAG TPA: low-specificity L-threonine aldolase [Candidatus Eremiobacteraceae bacterium]
MPERVIDLRSDTLTKPSQKMRSAMAAADVGDDVYDEDPTVHRLESECARTLGTEAALFVTSGTQANLVSVLSHCGRGDEIIVGDEAHIFYYELGGVSALGGVHVREVPNHDGILDPGEVERAIRGRDVHSPPTRLVCYENTHNRGGGRAPSAAQFKAVADVAHARDIKVHLDGARLFNAAVALNVSAAALCADADSVNICFSKGLGAPIGSAVAGSRDFIAQCRRYRKMVGGGMRQVGVLAAAALVALEDGPKRLHEDHANARSFAESLASSGKFDCDPASVQTNIVLFAPRGASLPGLHAAWRAAGVAVNDVGGGRFRAVTHLDVSRADVLEAADRLASVSL